MIRSFADKDTASIWAQRYVRGIDPKLQRTVLRKLGHLHAAARLDDLRVPPGNRLEAHAEILQASSVLGLMINGGCVLYGPMEV